MTKIDIALRLAFSLIVTGGLTHYSPVASAIEKKSEKAALTGASAVPSEDFSKVLGELEALFGEFYPKAKVKKTAKSLSVSYKCRKFEDSGGTGRSILAPQLDGVLLNLDVRDGRYDGEHVLPSRVNEVLYVSLKMAPYSEPENRHLMSSLLFSHNTPEPFVRKFQSILSGFEKQALVKKEKVESEVEGESIATAGKASVQEARDQSAKAEAKDDAEKKDDENDASKPLAVDLDVDTPDPEGDSGETAEKDSVGKDPVKPAKDASNVAQKDVDFGPYMAIVQKSIKNAWFPPKNDLTKRATATFKIHTDGKMTDLRLSKTSGNQEVDKAALAAVMNAAPFKALPDGAPKDVDIQFTFDYNVLKGGRIMEAVFVKETDKKALESKKAEGEKGEKVDFGGAKLSTYTFTDGRFQIKLPGKPNASARQMQGLRFAQYKYRESQGSYNIGYTVMPSQIPVASQNKVVSDLIQNLATVTKGKASPIVSLPWQGYPGRQVDVEKMPGDGFKSTRLRVILVRRYLYVIQAIGTDAWLKSPVVKNVLDSLVIRPELTSDEQAQLDRQAASRRTHSRASSSSRRSQTSRPRYNKEYERFKADQYFRRR